MRDIQRSTPKLTAALLAAAAGCATPVTFQPTSGAEAETARPGRTAKPGARDANLAGARCAKAAAAGEPCTCRDQRDFTPENPLPDDQHKRFEIRLSAEGGSATLDSPTLGHFAARDTETCYYIDAISGTTSDVVMNAKETWPGKGMGPELSISEYGPKGPYWYRILDVTCAGPNNRCNRDAADAWGAAVKTRQRGRVDPCGSTVITHLGWDTSGGTGDPELGLFRDFTVKFTMEVKRFATQFRPGSTECVPK